MSGGRSTLKRSADNVKYNNNSEFCTVEGCGNKRYIRKNCRKHHRLYVLKTKCEVSGCEEPTNMKGFCTKHLRRHESYGDTSFVHSRKIIGTCEVDRCDKEIFSLNMCTLHYQRKRKHGDVHYTSRNLQHNGRCSIEGCEGDYFAKNKCEKHYSRDSKRKRLMTRLGRERSRLDCQRRRARKRNAPFNDYNSKDWNDCLNHFDNRCAYCNIKQDVLDQEHVIPISKGGSNSKSNIVPSCGDCNSRKGARTIFEWYSTSEKYNPIRKEKILDYLGYKHNKSKIQLQLF